MCAPTCGTSLEEDTSRTRYSSKDGGEKNYASPSSSMTMRWPGRRECGTVVKVLSKSVHCRSRHVAGSVVSRLHAPCNIGKPNSTAAMRRKDKDREDGSEWNTVCERAVMWKAYNRLVGRRNQDVRVFFLKISWA